MMKIFLFILVTFSCSIICNGQKIKEFRVIDKGTTVWDVQFGEGNNLYVLSSDGQVKKVNTDSITSAGWYPVKATSMGISDSAGVIALGTSDGNLLVYNHQEQVGNFKAHRNRISHITFSSSNTYLATASVDSTIQLRSAKTYELIQEIHTKSDWITDIQFSLDDKQLVYSTSKGKIVVWNLDDRKELAAHQISNTWIRNIAICPDSVTFAVCGDDRKITILNFKNKDSYPLKKSHNNIVSAIQFMNKDYLLSIGHDHIISMNNIHLADEKAEIKHLKGYARYKRSLYDFSGDKYLSGLSISNDRKTVALSSYGKGIALTDEFHKIMENPHVVTIKELDNKKIGPLPIGIDPIFPVKNHTLILKGSITRPDEIKNAWIHYIKDDRKIKLKVDKDGDFKFQVGVYGELTDYAILLEDWDKNLKIVRYPFRLKQSD